MEAGSDKPSGHVTLWQALCALGQLVAFLFLTLPAVSVLAAVVLVPEYSRLKTLEYQRDLLRADNADMAMQVEAQERFNRGLLEDETLVKAFAMSEWNLTPKNEYVLVTPGATTLPVASITPYRHPRPEPPDSRLAGWAMKLEDPVKKRGIWLMISGSLLAAMFLFSPVIENRRKQSQNAQAA